VADAKGGRGKGIAKKNKQQKKKQIKKKY